MAFRCEDVRVKDGLLEVNTVVDNNLGSDIPPIQDMASKDSLDAISALSPQWSSSATTGSVSVTPREGWDGRGGHNHSEPTDYCNPNTTDDWPVIGHNNNRNDRNNYSQRQSVGRQGMGRSNRGVKCFKCNIMGHRGEDCRRSRRNWPNDKPEGRQRYNSESIWSTGGDKQSIPEVQTVATIAKRTEINLFPQLKDYYLNKSLSDVIIDINGQTVFAHEFVLSAKSEVFKEIFEGLKSVQGMDRWAKVELNDTNAEAFKLIIKFLYFEDLNLKAESAGNYQMAIEVLKLSIRFKIDRLSTLIEKDLIEMLEIENLVDFCKLCLELDLKKIWESLKSFVQKNENKIIETKAFISDSAKVMDKLLESMRSQKSIINGLKAIIETNAESGVKQFKRLIDCKKCSLKDIDVLKDMRIFSDEELYIIVRQKCDDLSNSRHSD